MSQTATELHPCAGGCGEMVRGTWKRGHKARFDAHGSCAGPMLLPGPDAGDDDLDAWEDLGIIGPPPNVRLQASNAPSMGPSPSDPDWNSPEDATWDAEEEISPDPPPLHAVKDSGKGRPKQTGHSQRRVTITVRKDIEAKLGLMLTVPGRVWAARDPVCGGAFLQSEPEIRSAAVELICQSPDLVEFFMGAGGGFMLWLNLLVACQPVVMTLWMHHIAHTLQVGDDGQVYQQVDANQYAA